MNRHTFEQDVHLPRWAYRLLALIAAGVLMIVVELAAFGLSALLPRERLRGLRLQLMLIGALLVGFEGVTIYVTQYLLAHSAEAHSQGAASQLEHQASKLAGTREAVALLRAKAARESTSPYAWIRETGAATLREAAAMETSADAEARELTRLQVARSPTLTDALGESGMLAYSVARALLISVMGLVMFGASGALLRASRQDGVIVTTAPTVTEPTVTQPVTSFAHGRQVTPAGASHSVPSLRRWAAAGVPIATVPAAFAAPTVTVTAPAPTVTAPAVTLKAPTVTTRTVTVPTATTRVRYERIRAGIEAGTIKPSVRAIQAAEGGGTAAVRACLKRMERDGVIERTGRGYALTNAAAKSIDTHQMNLIGGMA
jgi:hypothetical protein